MTAPQPTFPDVIHHIDQRETFDALFQQGASVTAGAPSELKFLIDRTAGSIYFLPPKYSFHFDFYRDVLHGPLSNDAFNEQAYNRPDRTFIAGTVTAYDSFVDRTSGVAGIVCFSLWPTDRFEVALLVETHAAVSGGLTFLAAGTDVAFRPGGPKQIALVEQNAQALQAAGIEIRTNVQISAGLRYLGLSLGTAVGTLRIVDRGSALPLLTRSDVALLLGDVPPDAPPVAAMITTQVQTYNSHLGIKFRQDDTPYFYQAFTDDELAVLRTQSGQPVSVTAGVSSATVAPATPQQAAAFLDARRPKGHIHLAPNLRRRAIRPFADLARDATRAGRWNADVLAAFGRKTMGVVQLAVLDRRGALTVGAAGAAGDAGGAMEPGRPPVAAPKNPFGIPASFYRRFVTTAEDDHGDLLSARIAELTGDRRFGMEEKWTAGALAELRRAMAAADLPAALRRDLETQLVRPYLAVNPGRSSARLRSSAPVVEDSGDPGSTLPNMAGAFDSHSARWKPATDPDVTVRRAVDAFAEALTKVYASVFNDRAIAELLWHNVDLGETSLTMAVLVMPNEDGELANGVIRVNRDLAGFFSLTGETQYGENLVTNPEAGASPDTWIDGDYDVLDGVVRQDIEYERFSNVTPSDPARVHTFLDGEINAAYDAMRVIRRHFAGLEGRSPQDYLDECEVKVLADGTVQIKQERPWVD